MNVDDFRRTRMHLRGRVAGARRPRSSLHSVPVAAPDGVPGGCTATEASIDRADRRVALTRGLFHGLHGSTALCGFSDDGAIGGNGAAPELGWRIPPGASTGGFDEHRLAQSHHFPWGALSCDVTRRNRLRTADLALRSALATGATP